MTCAIILIKNAGRGHESESSVSRLLLRLLGFVQLILLLGPKVSSLFDQVAGSGHGAVRSLIWVTPATRKTGDQNCRKRCESEDRAATIHLRAHGVVALLENEELEI